MSVRRPSNSSPSARGSTNSASIMLFGGLMRFHVPGADKVDSALFQLHLLWAFRFLGIGRRSRCWNRQSHPPLLPACHPIPARFAAEDRPARRSWTERSVRSRPFRWDRAPGCNLVRRQTTWPEARTCVSPQEAPYHADTMVHRENSSGRRILHRASVDCKGRRELGKDQKLPLHEFALRRYFSAPLSHPNPRLVRFFRCSANRIPVWRRSPCCSSAPHAPQPRIFASTRKSSTFAHRRETASRATLGWQQHVAVSRRQSIRLSGDRQSDHDLRTGPRPVHGRRPMRGKC